MYLIFGASGYVGKKFVAELTKRKQYHAVATRGDVNYYDFKDVSDAVRAASPKIIINCAGFVGKPNVDACEDDKENTYKGNVHLANLLAKISAIHDIPLAHVSSGCIYSGEKQNGNGFSEEDEPNFCFDAPPCSFYSGTKAEAEKQIRALIDKHYIWRLRIPFDEFDNSRNYISKLLNYKKLFNAKNSISHLGDFVNACLDSLEKKIPFGTYNIVNSGSITTKEVVKKIKTTLKVKKKFAFWKDEEEFYSKAAKTPRSNCVLDNSKLIAAGITMRSTDEALEEALKNWTKE